jgi:putative phosphoesterase
MMSITIFGDIHGNFPALEAVLADIEQRGLRNLYCLGDLVGYGTFPNEVISAIRERDIPTIKGNYDVGVGNNSDDCGCAYKTEAAKALGQQSIAWSNANTTDENKAFLRGLCSHIRLEMDGLRVLLVHGSPRKVNEYLYADRPDSSLERILDQAKADVMVCGHTHLPYHKILPSGRHVINAGSVGKPKDGDPRAGYVVLDVDDGAVQVKFVRVVYDVMKTVEAIQSTTMPLEFASMLQTATG